MLTVVLCEPQIAPNCGNIMRLCANIGAALHIIHPIGFLLNNPKMRRAACDYGDIVSVTEHDCFADCMHNFRTQRIFALTTHGTYRYDSVRYKEDDVLIFGAETHGLSNAQRAYFTQKQQLRIPMHPGNRSINLSNAVAITVYEALRQQQFRTLV